MSMTTLVILRFLGIFAAYMGVTLALPALMFRRICGAEVWQNSF